VGFIFQGVLGNNILLNVIVYPADTSFYNLLIKYLFSLYPPFHFLVIFSNIGFIADNHP